MNNRPLADRIRPENFGEMVGDRRLFGENGVFAGMQKSGFIPNMIFFGQCGTGKTTAANILAKSANKTLYKLNATTASVADIKQICAESGSVFGTNGIILYLDEIQYFNKKQQQSLLEFIEDGRITLIASTTENPYFYVYGALVSRCSVYEFKPVSPEQVKIALKRAADILKEERIPNLNVSDDTLFYIAAISGGDVRSAIGILETAAMTSGGCFDEEFLRNTIPEIMGMTGFDKDGDGHYDLLSALQKSIRGSDPDAAVFYLMKLLIGGDMLSACRRLQVIAAEDIGLAYPQAISIVHSCTQSARELGMPEARIPLANAAILLATAPKSNSAYIALAKASDAIQAGKGRIPPADIRDAHYDGAEKLGRGKGYKYPHDYENHYVKQQYLPDDIKNMHFYEYGANKTEQAARAYWDAIKNK